MIRDSVWWAETSLGWCGNIFSIVYVKLCKKGVMVPPRRRFLRRDTMRVHCLQHVPFEGLGSIAPWLDAAGFETTYTRFFESATMPDLKSLGLLVVMGGPMSVHDEAEFPWLSLEKQLIHEAIRSQIPVLGICLGAQLIASVLGARVYPNPVKEIGWFPVRNVPTEEDSMYRFPASETVFHWHGETFDLPSGARRLAHSEGCENQAFQWGRSVIGLQFHLETTAASARELVSHCRSELIPARYVQSKEEILSALPERYRSINQRMDSVLAYLLGSR